MEIFNKDFRRAMRGYEIKEVDQFLDLVLQSYEDVLEENNQLKDQVRQLKRGSTGRKKANNHGQTSDLAEFEAVLEEILVRLERLEKLNYS